MRYTVQYIPLSKIKTGESVRMTERLRSLRRLLWDCTHLMAVRKNKKDGTYTLLLGLDRYEFLRKHTTKTAAPCLVDETKREERVQSLVYWWRSRRVAALLPEWNPGRITPAGWAVIRAFLRQEPRFGRLSKAQQIKVLLMGVRYRKTVVRSMKSKVDEWLTPQNKQSSRNL